MKLLKIISFPILGIFYIFHFIILFTRNKLYNYKIYKTHCFKNTKIISVGSLKIGGAGKTPLVEYLISILPKPEIAILSRGYKRKKKGFLLARKEHSVYELGDEMNQVSKKNLDLTIAIDKNRVRGVRNILKKNDKKIIILDDGHQHRSLGRDLNILVTEYNMLYSNDFLFPLGCLREYRNGSKRANLIVVTKCPKNISEEEKKTIKNKLSVNKNQSILFSYIKKYKFIYKNEIINKIPNKDYFLVTGIASPQPLIEKLENMNINFSHFKYSDHHFFKKSDINKLIKRGTQKNITHLIITEKDFYRLTTEKLKIINSYFKLFYTQIEFDFIPEEKVKFNKQILKFI